MTRYIPRALEIEAHRYYGPGHPLGTPEGVCFCPAGKAFGDHDKPLAHCHTVQGPVQANVGDYIVTGEDEFWPVEPQRFHEKYAPVVK